MIATGNLPIDLGSVRVTKGTDGWVRVETLAESVMLNRHNRRALAAALLDPEDLFLTGTASLPEVIEWDRAPGGRIVHLGASTNYLHDGIGTATALDHLLVAAALYIDRRNTESAAVES